MLSLLGLSMGDTLLLLPDETPQEYTVCGIYSDITNGGKTAKAAFLPGGGYPMWSVFYQVSGMDRADSGEVWLDGMEICSLSEDDRARLRISQMGFVFQQMNMLKNLNLLDNILLPACYLNKGKVSRKELEYRARMLMRKMGIEKMSERRITEVSGGQIQRACICRSMMNQPSAGGLREWAGEI